MKNNVGWQVEAHREINEWRQFESPASARQRDIE
jgi:hypothetical protein